MTPPRTDKTRRCEGCQTPIPLSRNTCQKIFANSRNVTRCALRYVELKADGRWPTVRLASARQFQNSIAESVKIVIEHYIKTFGLGNEFHIHKFAIDHINGSHMFLPGFDRNPESLMGIEGVNVLWVEQAETVGSEMEKVIPTFIRTPGIELWFSWNASKRNQWCWQRFKENRRSTDVVAHVNYNDNPWWFVHCSACMERYPWGEAGGACAKCGGEKLPGLVEFERERQAIEVGEPDRYEHVYLGVPDDGDASRQVLTYSMAQACVRAYELGLYGELSEAPVTDMGFDVAEGGRDKCAQVIRRGPCIEFVDQWLYRTRFLGHKFVSCGGPE